MKHLVFAGAIAGACALAGAAPASAVVSDLGLSFTGTGISGTLDLSYTSATSPFSVDGVTGSVDVGGTTYTVTGLTAYAGDDQKAYYPSSSSVGYVDFPGISVETSGGFALNLRLQPDQLRGLVVELERERRSLQGSILHRRRYGCSPGVCTRGFDLGDDAGGICGSRVRRDAQAQDSNLCSRLIFLNCP